MIAFARQRSLPAWVLYCALPDLLSALLLQPVSCGVYDYVKGTASPPDHVSYTSSTIVNTGHTKTRSRGSDGSLSYTSVSWVGLTTTRSALLRQRNT